MAKRTSDMTDEEIRQSILGGLSITGMSFSEVMDILSNEEDKLPAEIYNKVHPTIRDWVQGNKARLENYIIADVENNEAEKKNLREQQFLADMSVVNSLIHYGSAPVVKKMQNEAVKHTKPNKAGRKFNMFHAIGHDSIYYANDVELLNQQGFNFNREYLINGKKVDFTQYNIDTLDVKNISFEKNVNNFIKTFQESIPQRNILIEKYKKLEQEKANTTGDSRRIIEYQQEEINKEYQQIMQSIAQHRVNTESNMQDFITCRQRLLKAVELNCITPENIQKIQNVDFDSKIQQLQSNYMRFKQTTNLLDSVSTNSPEKQHIAYAKPIEDMTSQNNTLAKASNNEPKDKSNIQTVQKQQLGASVKPENEDLVMNQTQQATKF